jgi:hypothetical protein
VLKPQACQIVPRAFWPACAVSLTMGLAAWALVLWRPEAFTQHWLRDPVALTAVHALVLGQLGLLMLAVSVQALPVLFHRPQFLQRPGARSGPLLWALGSLALLAFFLRWRSGVLLLPALAALAAAWVLAYRRALGALRGVAQPSFAWEGLGPAFLCLGLQVLLGAALAAGLLQPLLPQDPLLSLQLHVHLGLWGVAALATFGFLPKLLRLFQASVGYTDWPLRPSFAAIQLGLALLFLRWLGLLGARAAAAAGLCFFTGSLLHALQLAYLLRAARARRLDSSLAAQLSATLFLLAAAALDAWLLAGHGGWREQAACAALGLAGFLSLILLGSLQRIGAVLAWFQRFNDAALDQAVPTAWDLVHPGLAWSQTPLQSAAALALAWGLWQGDALWIRLAGLCGAAAQLVALGLLAGVLTRGRAQPFPGGVNPYAEWAAQQAARAHA